MASKLQQTHWATDGGRAINDHPDIKINLKPLTCGDVTAGGIKISGREGLFGVEGPH